MRARPTRSVRAAVLAVTAGTVVACGGAAPAPGPDPVAEEPGRLSGELWLNPEGRGPVAVEQALAEGRTEDAETLEPLAEQPTATWLATPENPYDQVLEISEAAAAAGELPVLVAYNVPNRDCGSYSSGGAADVEAYLAWIGSFAAALGDRPAVVVLEPDAVPQAVVGCEGVDRAARFQLLSQAVDILDRQPETSVYLDAGNVSWVEDLPVLADALRASGVDRAEGFSLNVANFEPTDETAEYGLALSRELEEGAPPEEETAHVVIDTSRNGAGPLPEGGPDEERWCNPPGRELGEPPTTSTDLPRVDALLWIKQPGDSDGTCRGGPPAGEWWPEAAQDLATEG
ncbi:glycoside hydrolase family 6 protein [Geodermatophilus sp. DSM 45219]|uniref:glycoside hydrolase family 6 protein n=1 Tax=Geodermatophilus sp. DSM 45219 TaxID=1881103 RepID=UPI001C40B057|nr:glycoside hydrolase family 6 protein [Geodermatophilus sp. DSM 45219]